MTREFRFRTKEEAEQWCRAPGVYGDTYWTGNTTPAIRREIARYKRLGDAYPFKP